ncbi:hypothetical protein E2562_039377 [Oryza meyeriana var. granulata]|uniref:Hydrophobic seed protein domain-containing protein n=1 Tax=Oryza meyeriana var. granulata TaxID=110450 RepID=A0A6G1CME2_9ORYZ|nr:hypothetical protein E2562_039377 [Oryza meyeriana var. granulata]
MAPTRSITAHATVVAVVVAAMLCLTGAKQLAACELGKSNCLPTMPPVAPAAAAGGKCPTNVAKLGVYASVLDGLIHAKVGKAPPPKEPCCPLIAELADADAAVCVPRHQDQRARR